MRTGECSASIGNQYGVPKVYIEDGKPYFELEDCMPPSDRIEVSIAFYDIFVAEFSREG